MTTALKVGNIVTVAGMGNPGWAGDGGAAVAALLNEPKHVTIESTNIFIVILESRRRIER
jgi:hypothetical protein